MISALRESARWNMAQIQAMLYCYGGLGERLLCIVGLSTSDRVVALFLPCAYWYPRERAWQQDAF